MPQKDCQPGIAPLVPAWSRRVRPEACGQLLDLEPWTGVVDTLLRYIIECQEVSSALYTVSASFFDTRYTVKKCLRRSTSRAEREQRDARPLLEMLGPAGRQRPGSCAKGADRGMDPARDPPHLGNHVTSCFNIFRSKKHEKTV